MQTDPAIVCIIVAGPDHVLDEHIVQSIARLARGTARWLAKGTAAEITTPLPKSALSNLIPSQLPDLAVDIFLVPAENRKKKMLISDMDSTMIGIECIDELADYANVKGAIAAITEKAMAGEISFEQALEERVLQLKGLPVAAIKKVIEERLTYSPGARELVCTMRKAGAATVLVSGGFTPFTSHVANTLGFDRHFANDLKADGSTFTGRVRKPILGPRSKLDIMSNQATELGIGFNDILAVGDGANDRDMVNAAGLGASFRGKVALEAVSDVAIRHSDLRSLLYLQGYSEEEISSTP